MTDEALIEVMARDRYIREVEDDCRRYPRWDEMSPRERKPYIDDERAMIAAYGGEGK